MTTATEAAPADHNMPAGEGDNVRRTEAWVEHDSHQFYTVTYEPTDQPVKATVTFIHGIGEHIDRYDYLMRVFARAGLRSHGYDQRGFGKTGQRNGVLGDSEGFEKVLDDVVAANERVRIDGLPHFLYGHSMGGLIVLSYGVLRNAQQPVTGIVSTGPAIHPDKSVRPGILKRSSLSVVARLLPSFQIEMHLDPNYLSHDPAVVAAYKASEYNISHASLRTLKDLLDQGDAMLDKGYAHINMPVLIIHGGEDHMTSPAASRKFFDKLPADMDKEYVLLEGEYHEVHNEVDKDKAINLARDWLLKHIPQS